jgi:hypothetical protein
MPDAKITALTAISVIDVAADVLPIVDISDTSMAASGTTKKITINQILGASGAATFSALTVSGAATAQRFIPSSATVPTNGMYLPAANELGWAINSAEAMRLNSTGLGVGGSPQAKIHAIDSGGVCALFTRAAAPSAALSAVYIQAPVSSGFSSTPILTFWFQNTGISNPASETLSIRTNSAERIRYGSDGNAYHSLQGTVPTIPNNGEMVFNFTSNTNLRISARGSDGVTRVANITLA